MVKLIRVTCRRQTDNHNDRPFAGIAFAADKAHAEQLCREAFADHGYTSFEADEPVEGPFENVQPQVLVFEGRRLSATSISEIRSSATRVAY